MHDAERAVGGVHVNDDDAQAIHIDDVGERRALAQHLAIDAVQVLFAALDLRLDAAFSQGRFELLLDLVEKLLLVAARALERALEHAVAMRVEGAKAQILELELDAIEPEALGHRRIDIERLTRHQPPLGGCKTVYGAQVVGAISELDQDDAQVTHHRQQHLAETLGLRFLAILEADLIELGDAIDDLGHILAKALGDVFLGNRGIFDDIVQDRCNDRVGIEP